MDNKSRYIVNDDGSITKIGGNCGHNTPNNSGGSSGNSGCLWVIIIAVVIGIVIAIATNLSDSSDSTLDLTAVVVEDVEDAVVKEVYTPSTTYLNVSDNNIYMSSDGGSTNITISTDGDWYIDISVAEWGHLTKNSNSVTLRLDRNTSRSSRTDYFVIKSGNYTKRIDITQSGNTSPSADIEKIWVDHNVYQNGLKGMKIHVRFTVDNMKGNMIYGYVFLYYKDNVTPLHDPFGNNLSFYSYGTSNYDGSIFEDFQIFVPYNGLNMQPGAGSIDLSFDISIRTSSGTELDRDNNTQFTYTQY